MAVRLDRDRVRMDGMQTMAMTATMERLKSRILLDGGFSVPGDADLDVEVSLADFVIVKQNFGDPGGWTEGDFSRDGRVGLEDFDILKARFGLKASALPIERNPTPTRTRYVYGPVERPLHEGVPAAPDVDQGQLATCYFLGPLAGMEPETIYRAIGSIGDGTYWVRLHSYEQVDYILRIDGDLPLEDGEPVYAQATEDKWVALLEKAWAIFRYDTYQYAAAEWGYPGETMAAIFGEQPAVIWTSGYTVDEFAAAIGADLDAGMTVALTSVGNPPPETHIVGSHVYAAVAVRGDLIDLYNPHGDYRTVTREHALQAFWHITSGTETR